MLIRKMLLRAVVAGVSMSGLAAPPGGHLSIHQVMADNPNDPTAIAIIGKDFMFGPGTPVVTFGVYVDPLIIVGVLIDEVIVALLPDNIIPGDYLLTVAIGNGQSQDDEYDLTIGAVGPQGPQGEQGVRGEQGPRREQGLPGLPDRKVTRETRARKAREDQKARKASKARVVKWASFAPIQEAKM